MWRGTLLILPLFVLIGAGCMIGNKDGDDIRAKSAPDPVVQEQVQKIEVGAPQVTFKTKTNAEISIVEGSVTADDSVAALAPLEIALKSGNFYFDPPLIEAKPGQEVRVTVSENMGLHTFLIDEIAFKAQLSDGAAFSFIAPHTPGDYAFYCDIGEHRKLGMEGTLRVQ
jgi:plastocyanin